jgi:hypothetical protein
MTLRDAVFKRVIANPATTTTQLMHRLRHLHPRMPTVSGLRGHCVRVLQIQAERKRRNRHG